MFMGKRWERCEFLEYIYKIFKFKKVGKMIILGSGKRDVYSNF